jgi:GDP-4-dehydro-6-deoxy-D-mannose reductase
VRAYLTGGSGFVGTWLHRHLDESGDTTVGAGVDVTDADAVAAEMRAAAPEVVFHLAALSHVGRSWADPSATFRVNAEGTLNVLEAAARCAEPPTVVLVSSAEVYGLVDGASQISEATELRPLTPYAVSKVAAEFLGVQAHLGRNLRVIRTRPFNHVGPGQSDDFVVAAIARRLIEAEAAGGDSVRVGNLTATRDFTDVRDVVRAYRLLVHRGVAGEVYNVCSGKGIKIADLVAEMAGLLSREIKLIEDPTLVRPVEVPSLVGDASKLVSATGWQPRMSRLQTLGDVLEDWRGRILTR